MNEVHDLDGCFDSRGGQGDGAKATLWCGQLFGLWEFHAGPLVQRIALGDERNLGCFCMALALVTGKTD